MGRGPKKPEMGGKPGGGMTRPGKPDVTLPYMPQKPMAKPAMPMRRAKGGMAKGKKK